MKLPSTVIHLEIAKVGEGFVVTHDVHSMDSLGGGYGGAAQIPVGPRSLYLKTREELQAWFANMECKV